MISPKPKRSKPPADRRLSAPKENGTVLTGREQLADGALLRSLSKEDLHRLELARRLHKDVAGNLVACTAVTEMIRHQLAAGGVQPADIAAKLASIDAALRQTLQIVRELTEEQVPPVLTAFGLTAALQQFVKQAGAGFSGSLILHIKDEDLVLDPASRLNLFRILQTLIRRCICDARATCVEVACLAGRDGIEFAIDHNGSVNVWAGSDQDDELALIIARCTLLGATLHLSPSAAAGGLPTRLLLSLPAPAPSR